jgi:hypothetical protein
VVYEYGIYPAGTPFKSQASSFPQSQASQTSIDGRPCARQGHAKLVSARSFPLIQTLKDWSSLTTEHAESWRCGRWKFEVSPRLWTVIDT